MGGKGTARERVAAGLDPVPGIDMSLEDAEAFLATLKPEPVAEAPRRSKADRPSSGGATALPADGVTATVRGPCRR